MPHAPKPPAAAHPRLALLLPALLLAGCGDSPEALLNDINNGDAAQALSTLEQSLAEAAADDPNKSALQLLAAHARLTLCAQRSCVQEGKLPALLEPVGGLLTAVPGAVSMGEKLPPLTSSSVVISATQAFATLAPQPGAMLTLRQALPEDLQTTQLGSLFLPARMAARTAVSATVVARLLQPLDDTATLPQPVRFAAGWLAAEALDEPALRDSRHRALLANRDAVLPQEALSLIPHAWRLGTAAAQPAQGLAPFTTWLETLPDPLHGPQARRAIAEEFRHIAETPALHSVWQGLEADAPLLPLTFKTLSLQLNPEQPALWSGYLQTLVARHQAGQPLPPLALGQATDSLKTMTSPVRQRLGQELLNAAQQLKSQPQAAAPLLAMAAQLGLESAQLVALDKLALELIQAAATAKNVSATLALALARPEAATNSRQVVIPLLVEEIRRALQQGRFEDAVATTSLINDTLKLPLELAPLMLEEFKAMTTAEQLQDKLSATSPTWLVTPAAQAALPLGPIWDFMTEYFAEQPEILTAELNDLIANAEGVWGPASAMHRLKSHFPVTEQARLEEWLMSAITAATLADGERSGAELVTLTEQLLAVHPRLARAPLLNASLQRADTLEESQSIWQAAGPATRTAFRTLRPQYSALMRGLEALAAGNVAEAANELATVSESPWYEQAAPARVGLERELVQLRGVYVPLQETSALPTAALILTPQAFAGGSLTGVSITLINRLGTLAETDPATLVSTPAALRVAQLVAPYRFGARTLPLEAALAEQGNGLAPVFGPMVKATRATEGELLTLKLAGGQSATFTRVLYNPTAALRPDGVYTIRAALTHSLTPRIVDGANILPNGSILTLQTAPVPEQTAEGPRHPLIGVLRHPASDAPISFSGSFDPATMVSSFSFAYPLPGGAPVQALAKCQTLLGSITCGAHHRHSPKNAYAALSRGLQTQESLTTQAAERERLNLEEAAALATTLQQTAPVRPARAVSATTEASSPSATIAASPSLAVAAVPPPTTTAANPVSGVTRGATSVTATMVLTPPETLAQPASAASGTANAAAAASPTTPRTAVPVTPTAPVAAISPSTP